MAGLLAKAEAPAAYTARQLCAQYGSPKLLKQLPKADGYHRIAIILKAIDVLVGPAVPSIRSGRC